MVKLPPPTPKKTVRVLFWGTSYVGFGAAGMVTLHSATLFRLERRFFLRGSTPLECVSP